MAQEILNKIREAEDKAQEIVNTAAIAAREIVREANTKAEAKISETAQEIKVNTAKILETAEKEAVAEFDALKEKLADEIEEKKKAAQKNLKDVREYILGRIL